ncbi:MAG: hypothetical protein PVI30_00555 [Myxococcales bacterium]|jgi:hypothetical protein
MKRFAVGLAALLSTHLAAAQPAALPRYAEIMEAELRALGLSPRCRTEAPTRHHCTYAARSSLSERGLRAHAVYDDETDTVHVYVERYLKAPADAPGTPAVLARLMELNWELLVGKFQWSPTTGEVRLSAVLATDTNFDRRAFRSLLRTLDIIAARHRAELQRLAGGKAPGGHPKSGSGSPGKG